MSLPTLESLRKEKPAGNTVYNLLLSPHLFTKFCEDFSFSFYLLILVLKSRNFPYTTTLPFIKKIRKSSCFENN